MLQLLELACCLPSLTEPILDPVSRQRCCILNVLFSVDEGAQAAALHLALLILELIRELLQPKLHLQLLLFLIIGEQGRRSPDFMIMKLRGCRRMFFAQS